MHGRRILFALALTAGAFTFAAPAFATDYEEQPPDVDTACDPSVTAEWTPEQWASFGAALAKGIAEGHDFGPPPCGQVEAECRVTIDPPEAIEVTLANLTANGSPIDHEETTVYLGGGFGLATFDLTGHVFGHATITADATWNIGTGTLHLTGETTCPDAPPTTTTPPTTAPPSHVCPGGATTGVETPCEAPTPTTVIGTPVPAQAPPTLPHTGSTAVPLLTLGSGLVATGFALLARARASRGQ